jgi:hypothetical protein
VCVNASLEFSMDELFVGYLALRMLENNDCFIHNVRAYVCLEEGCTVLWYFFSPLPRVCDMCFSPFSPSWYSLLSMLSLCKEIAGALRYVA